LRDDTALIISPALKERAQSILEALKESHAARRVARLRRFTGMHARE
jgi:hypothetical protein